MSAYIISKTDARVDIRLGTGYLTAAPLLMVAHECAENFLSQHEIRAQQVHLTPPLM